MTVAYQSNRRDYSGNGSTQDFSVPFELFSSGDLKVYRRDETDPANITETLLVLSSDYTLTGADPAHGIICTGIHTSVAPSVTQKIVILREMVSDQGLDFNVNGPFPVDDNEKALDRGAMIDQQLQEQIDRSVKLPTTARIAAFDPTLPRDLIGQQSCALGTNPSGNGLAVGPTFTAIAGAQAAGNAAVAAAAAAATSAAASATSAGNAASSATSASTSATNAAASQAAAAASAAAAAASAAASGALAGIGTHAAPTNITAAGGIPGSGNNRSKRYIQGNGGPVDIIANPQVAAGLADGDELTLVGCSDTNTVLLENGTGLVLNGAYTMKDGSLIRLNWDAGQSLWLEEYRNDL
jgi:hypothetical protein